MNENDQPHETPDWLPDLAEHAKRAPSRKRLAYDALKRGEDPQYVACRYGFDVEIMRKVAAELPPVERPAHRYGQSNFAARRDSESVLAGELLSEMVPGDQVHREPGCDDDLE